MIIENAYAKINLYLDVINKREDGFHDILSVMHTVSLCDIVTVDVKESPFAKISLSMPNSTLPCDERNIAYRAAEMYLERAGLTSEINIKIEKNIPIGAGLAGGSTDAAATLRALNKIYKRLDEKELLEICASLGSDVPYCFLGGTAICEGRGEIMTPITVKPAHYVIAIGEERVNTKAAYGELDSLYSDFADARSSEKIKEGLMKLDGFEASLYNIFEDVAPDGVKKLKERLKELSASAVLMSGSGPSVFGIFNSEKEAKAAANALNLEGYTAYSAKTVIQ